MDQWILHAKRADFKALAAKFGIDQVTARLIRNRDVITEEGFEQYLNATTENLYDPFLLPDMNKTVEILLDSIRKKEQIRVIGDYDIDGVCSTYILVKGMRSLGAAVDYAIPNRIRDGYGLNDHLIEKASQAGTSLIVTCDNGIAALSQIEHAYELGMRVIVTDHHEVGYEESNGERMFLMPKAEAVVNPKRVDTDYPFREICGGLVAYKVISALYRAAGKTDTVDFKKLDQELFSFAAFATVGDVMELKDENRIVVKYGIKLLQNTENMGLRALMEVNGLTGRNLTAYHLGFVLGPCLNATGRLDTADRAMKLFLTEDRNEAVQIAGELKGLNDSRKDLTAKGVLEAEKIVEETEIGKDRVLVLYLPECHESLAGIIAGRIREKYSKPVFVLTDGEDGVKGSGRSIEAYSMFEKLNECKSLLTKFGGHKLAAGLSLEKENVELLRKQLNEHCELAKEDMVNKVYIDMELPVGYITMPLIQQFELLEPFGNGNPKPVFAMRGVRLLQLQILGKNRNVARFTAMDLENRRFTMMYFGNMSDFQQNIDGKYGEGEYQKLEQGDRNHITLSILFYPDINEYKGNRQIQYIMQSYQLN